MEKLIKLTQYSGEIMNDSNEIYKNLATSIDSSKIKTKRNIIAVRVNSSSKTAGAVLSSRPLKSIIKAKSLMKPLTSSSKKKEEEKVL